MSAYTPKDAAYARKAIADTAAGTPSRKARQALALGVETVGNYDDEGRQLWRDYLARGCPAAGEAGL